MSTIMAILVLIAGIALLLPVIAFVDKSRNPKVGCVLLISALALTVPIHELGYLIAGWMAGFRFSVIHIGPFSLTLEHGRFKARMTREMIADGAVGMHIKSVRRLHRRLLIGLAGGSAANLLSIPAAFLLVGNVLSDLGETRQGTLAAQFVVFSVLSIIVNLWPTRAVMLSDGARIEMLLCSRDRSRRWMSVLALVNLYNNGIRGKDWKPTWLRSATCVNDNSLDAFFGYWLAYASANDRRDVVVAGQYLEKCLELSYMLPLSMRDMVAQEAAFFAAWFRDDASLAYRWLTQLHKPRVMPRSAQLRLDVALACARRDYDAAERSWQEGFRLIESSTSGRSREWMKEASLEWRQQILERRVQDITVSSNADECHSI
ncbi:MAG TPA: hypothetical protein VK302_13330 [Terriglobales bacterium]|nr:hypothetical protein [Terriglobales bacterium]